MKTIVFHGRLADRFGPQISMDVRSPAEAIRALVSQVPGFYEEFSEGYYDILCGPMVYTEHNLNFAFREQLDIIPVVLNAKSGAGKLILGVALVALAFAAPYSVGLLAGTGLFTGEMGAIGFAHLLGTAAFTIGAASILTGAASLLSPKPKLPNQDPEYQQKSMLINTINTSLQGQPLPVALGGPILVGSAVASSGVYSEEVQIGSSGVTGSTPDGNSFFTSFDQYVDATRLGTIIGAKSGKSGSSSGTSQESQNTFLTDMTAKVIDVISAGEIAGFVDSDHPLRNYFMDQTSVERDSGTGAPDIATFKGVQVHFRSGTMDQDVAPGFDEIVTENIFSSPITVFFGSENRVVRTVTDPTYDAVRVLLNFNTLTEQSTTDGSLSGSSVTYRVGMRAHGFTDFDWIVTRTLSEKFTSPVQIQHRIDLPKGEGPWDIAVERMTADATTVNVQNSFEWVSYSEIVDANLIYPGTAYVASIVAARQFGQSIPARAFLINGAICSVPTNYDTSARTYTGIWDGTFKRAWTNNGVWCTWEVLTNSDWGFGDRITSAVLDKWSFYEGAVFADELVPDGEGGLEPRFRMAAWVKDLQEARAFIQTMCSNFLGKVIWGRGAAMLTQSSRQTSRAIITNSNVIGGKFVYEGIGRKAINTMVHVQWQDPQDFYRPATDTVQDPDLIRRFGRRAKSVVAWGCIWRGQALRQGRWELYSDYYSNPFVTFSGGLELATVLPGQIMDIHDVNQQGVRSGGRIKSHSDTTIVMDSDFPFEIGQTYIMTVALDKPFLSHPTFDRSISSDEGSIGDTYVDLTIAVTANSAWTGTLTQGAVTKNITSVAGGRIHLDNTTGLTAGPCVLTFSDEKGGEVSSDLVERTVVSWSDDNTTVTVDSPLPCTMDETFKFHFGLASDDLVKAQYIAIAFSEKDDQFQIVALKYFPELFDLVDSDKKFSPRPSSVYDTTQAILPPTDATTVYRLIQGAAGPQELLELSWDKSESPLVYKNRISWRYNNGIWTVDEVYANNYDIPYQGAGKYEWSIVAIPPYGKESQPLTGSVTTDQVRYLGTVGLANLRLWGQDPSITTFSGRTLKFQWDSTPPDGYDLIDASLAFGAEDNRKWVDPFFQSYEVRIEQQDGTLLRSYFPTDPFWQYTAEMLAEDNGGAMVRELIIKVRLIDIFSTVHPWVTQTYTNPAPSLVEPLLQATASGYSLIFPRPDELDFAGYRVWQSVTSGFTPGPGNLVWDNAGNPTIPATGGSTIYYKFAIFDDYGEDELVVSSERTVTIPNTSLVDTTAPATPTGLSLTTSLITNTDKSQIVTLTAVWTANGEADLAGYEASLTIGGSQVIYPTKGTRYSWTVPGATSCSVKIAAIDVSGNISAYCTTQVLTSASDTTAPSAPTGMSAVGGFQSISISWTNPSDSDLDQILVFEGLSGVSSGATQIASFKASAGTLGNYTRSGLADFSTRFYWLKAMDRSGNISAFSGSTNATCTSITPDILSTVVTVAVPTGLSLTSTVSMDPVTNQPVTILKATWSANSETTLSGYEIALQEGSGSFTTTRTNSTLYTWIVKANTSYTAKVRAIDKNSNASAFSSTQTLTTTKDSTPPAAPTSLTSLALFKQIALAWTTPSDVDTAQIQIWQSTTNSSGTASLVSTVPATPGLVGSTTIGNLTNGIPYFFWIKAVDTSFNASTFSSVTTATPSSISSPDISTTPGAGIPGTPSLTTSITIDSKTGIPNISLTAIWSAASGSPAGYEVQLTKGSVVTIDATNGLTYTWTGLIANSAYSVQVRSVDRVGNVSAFSSSTSITSSQDTTPPSAPTSLSGIGLFKQVSLAWLNPADLDTSAIEIWQNTINATGSATRVAIVNATPTSAGSTIVGNLTNGTAYFFWIRAVDTSGNQSAFSAVATATPSSITGPDTSGTPSTGVPSAPSLSTSIAIDTKTGLPNVSITATWGAVTGNPASYQAKLTNGSIVIINSTTGLTYTWNGLIANISYSVQIASVDKVGNVSAYSTVSTITSGQDSTAPSAPTLVSASAGIGTVIVTWTNPSDADFTQALVFKSTTNDSSTATQCGSSPGFPGTAGVCAVTGLTTGTPYFFWIKAVDTSGNVSVFSTVSTATPITISTTDLANGIINSTKLAASITAIQIVNTSAINGGTVVAPTNGAFAYNQFDSKLYKSSAADATHWSIWQAAAADISGTLTDSQLAGIAAAKLTGQITGTQITDRGITAIKIAAGTITANEIFTGTITGDKLFGATITGDKIQGTTITGANIAGNTITGDKIVATTITAGLIAAGAIGTTQLSAGAVTANKMLIGSLDNLIPNPTSEDTAAVGAGSNGRTNVGSTAYSGQYVRQVVSPNVDGNSVNIIDGSIPCSPGDQFYFEARAYNSNTSLFALANGFFRDALGNGIANTISFSPYFGVANTWGLTSGVYQAPAGAVGFIPYIYAYNAAGTVFFDSLYCRKMLTGSLVVDGTITASKITVDSVLANLVVADITRTNVLNANVLVSRSITAGLIAAGTITANEILSATITGGNIAGRTITAGNLTAHTITANEITARTITANEILAHTITANEIHANTITANEIQAHTISALQIVSGTITSNEIAANTITAANIAAGTITASKLVISDNSNFITDPGFSDQSAWSLNGSGVAFDTSATITSTLGAAGGIVINGNGTTTQGFPLAAYQPVLVEPSKWYRISATSLVTSNFNGTALVFVNWSDRNGGFISQGQVQGNNHFSGAPGVTTIVNLTNKIQAPSNAWSAQFFVCLFANSSAAQTGALYFAHPRFGRAIDAALIVDGTITGTQIAAQTIQAGNILSNTITATQIASNTITAGNLNVSILSSITANIGTVTAGLIQNASGTNFYDVTNGLMVSTAGSYKKVIGAGFGASNDLVEWFGLASTATASMTKINGVWSMATDGKVYFGATSLGSTGGFSQRGTVGSSISVTNSGWTTLCSASFTSIPGAGFWNISASGGYTGLSNPFGSGLSGTGAWRITEMNSVGTETVLSTGTWTCSWNSSSQILTFTFFDQNGLSVTGSNNIGIQGLAVASNYTGAVSIRLEMDGGGSSSGSTHFDGGFIQASWTPAG